jgi:AraC-like DNA-binding protein
LAKIAAEFEKAVARRAAHGGPGRASARLLADGPGWRVSDIVCDHGPQDHPFEEQHSQVAIAVVAAGSFQYRSEGSCDLMTPGSLLLGNPGQCFECSHHHCAGDRCISFQYAVAYFEQVAADAGASAREFPVPRLSPVRELSVLISRACAGLAGSEVSWEELSLQLAARTLTLVVGHGRKALAAPSSTAARITRVVRRIERNPNSRLALADLAQEARLSPYHFLRAFQQLTGMTPHQYVVRSRLREAALQLTAGRAKVLDIALDSGFGDVSNFNRAFRAEFDVSPRSYRAGVGRPET